MNGKQKRVVLVGVFLVALAGLIPPWRVVYSGPLVDVHPRQASTYGFLLSPPTLTREREPYADYLQVKLDLQRLAVEWATIGLVSFGLVIWLGGGKDSLDP